MVALSFDPVLPEKDHEALPGFREGEVLQVRLDHFFDHSLGAFCKALPFLAAGQRLQAANPYLGYVAAVGLALYFWRIQYLPLVNQGICLTVAGVLFMPVSFDYTLVQLGIPLAMPVLLAVDAARRGESLPGLNEAFACVALLCSPLTEFTFHGITPVARLKQLC